MKKCEKKISRKYVALKMRIKNHKNQNDDGHCWLSPIFSSILSTYNLLFCLFVHALECAVCSMAVCQCVGGFVLVWHNADLWALLPVERWSTWVCVCVCMCEQVINDKIIIKAKRKQKRNEFILVSHVKCHAAFMTSKWRDGSDGDGERARVCLCLCGELVVGCTHTHRSAYIFFHHSAAKGKI